MATPPGWAGCRRAGDPASPRPRAWATCVEWVRVRVCERERMCTRGRERVLPARSEDIFLTFHSDAPISCLCLSLASFSRFCPLHLPQPVPSPAPKTLLCRLLYIAGDCLPRGWIPGSHKSGCIGGFRPHLLPTKAARPRGPGSPSGPLHSGGAAARRHLHASEHRGP